MLTRFPQTPGIKGIEALLNSLVYNKGFGRIGRNDELYEAVWIGYDRPYPEISKTDPFL